MVKESETTDPNMATSSSMIGSNVAWADGYTGAGSKVAIIDTGADTDHPSLNGAAYSYAVKGLGITPVTAADYADKLEKLNAFKKNGDLKASDLYVSAKIPFASTTLTPIWMSPTTTTARVTTFPRHRYCRRQPLH